MHNEITTDSIPFRWRGKEYRITRIGLKNPTEPFASVVPDNPELVDELKRRLVEDQGFSVYRGKGFKCFPEVTSEN